MILDGLREQEVSTLYGRLAVRAMDVNELCLPIRRDIERVGMMVARENLLHQHLRAIERISDAEYRALTDVLREGLDDGPVLLRFPEHDPPPRAA